MLFRARHSLVGGISTIELMVTISIFMLISTAVLISYPQLSSSLSLDKTAQEIASYLHETRMYGIGVKSLSGSRPAGFGLHFDITNPNAYILFSEDSGGDKKYQDIEKISEYKINAREIVSDLCVFNDEDTGGECNVVSADTHCLSDGSIKSIDILFLRPAPSVFINGFGDEGASVCPAGTCATAEIIVKSPRGKCKKIEVWTTGQVSIKAPRVP